MEEKKRILVAEDEKPLAQVLSAKLTNEGFDPFVVYNGVEAVEAAEKEAFSLAIIDLVMPELDGFGVLEKLKEKKITVPVIVVSNLAQEVDRKRAEELGAVGYFVKSNIPLSEVVEQVKTILKK